MEIHIKHFSFVYVIERNTLGIRYCIVYPHCVIPQNSWGFKAYQNIINNKL